MKKLFSILFSTVFLFAFFAFIGCSENGDKTTEYDVNEYFQSMNAPHDLARFLGNEEPTGADYLCLKAKNDVKITKISGTAYYNYDWLGDQARKDLDKYYAPLPDSKIMTTEFEQNVEITKNVPTHFDFVLSKEYYGALKAGENIGFDFGYKLGAICAVRNLKVEFTPA